MRSSIHFLAVLLISSRCLLGGDEGNSSLGGKILPPDKQALLPVADTPGLPRVLLMGDSISIGYTVPVREALAGVANVHRPGINCAATPRGLAGLDEWLGDGKWDVIHFNWGLHDLKYVDGKRNIPPEEYEKNLREIVAHLKKTGASLIWATTTPVPKGISSPKARVSEDVELYNSIAEKIMRENAIAVDDLYAFALPRLDRIQLRANVHFSDAGSAALAEQVAASIRNGLGARKVVPKTSQSSAQ